MVPMPSYETSLPPSQRAELLAIARRAIAEGLDGRRLRVTLADLPASLQTIRASFVTLRIGGHLRGCIGTIEARRPLAEDVAYHAYAAAFEDPRMPPLARHELSGVDIHLSLLSPLEPLEFDSEQDLLRQLRPTVDGLVLQEGVRRGTFLPSVWAEVPDPVVFLRQLKRKTGLPVDYWSSALRVSRYTAESVP